MIYGGLFDLDNKIKRKEEINEIINDVSFWSTSSKDDVLKEYNSLSNTIDKIKILKDEIKTGIDLLSGEVDEDILNLLNPDYNQQSKLNNNRVIKCKLSNNDYPSNMDCQTIY